MYANNTLVARKGTDVYGRLANAQEAGHLSGSAELQLELMRMVIDGRDYPLVSSDYSLKGKGRGARYGQESRRRGRRWARSSARLPAAEKAQRLEPASGSAAGAGVQVFTRGQQVKVPSETLLEFRLQQPAVVTPHRAEIAKHSTVSGPAMALFACEREGWERLAELLAGRCRIGSMARKFSLASPTVSD